MSTERHVWQTNTSACSYGAQRIARHIESSSNHSIYLYTRVTELLAQGQYGTYVLHEMSVIYKHAIAGATNLQNIPALTLISVVSMHYELLGIKWIGHVNAYSGEIKKYVSQPLSTRKRWKVK